MALQMFRYAAVAFMMLFTCADVWSAPAQPATDAQDAPAAPADETVAASPSDVDGEIVDPLDKVLADSEPIQEGGPQIAASGEGVVESLVKHPRFGFLVVTHTYQKSAQGVEENKPQIAAAQQILVRLFDSSDVALLAGINQKSGATVGFQSTDNTLFLLKLPERGLGVLDAAIAFYQRELGNKGLVSTDQLFGASLTPNDPDFSRLWGLHQSSDVDIDAPEAWDLTEGSDAVVVAVVDTGIDDRHPDLAANMWRNPGEIAGNGIDDDRNGFVDDIHGADFVNNDGNPTDDHVHGTHVAGTIAAAGNNRVGVIGVSPRARLMALKVLDINGSGLFSNVVRAWDYAIANKAKVINNSLGGRMSSSQLMIDAANRVHIAGIVNIAAAGNSASNNDSVAFAPADLSTRVPGFVSVASVESTGLKSYFSNFGLATVNVAAPGSNIWSTVPERWGGRYLELSGTSMAAPHVAGIAALILARQPALSPAEVRNRLESTSVRSPHLSSVSRSGGMVNAYQALLQSPPPPAQLPVIPTTRWVAGLAPDNLHISLLSPRDGRIYVASYGNRVHVINPQTEKREHTYVLPPARFAINDMNFSPDGRYLAVAGDGVAIIDTGTRTYRKLPTGVTVPGGEVDSAAFLRDATTLVLKSRDTSLFGGPPVIVDARTGGEIETLPTLAPSQGRFRIKSFPNGNFFVVVGHSSVDKFDFSSRPTRRVATTPPWGAGWNMSDFGLDPAGQNVFTAAVNPFQINRFAASNLTFGSSFSTSAYPNSVVISPSGSRAYSTSNDWTQSTGRRLFAFGLRQGEVPSRTFALQSLARSPHPQLDNIYGVKNYWTATERGLATSASGGKVFVTTGEHNYLGGLSTDAAQSTDQIQIIDTDDKVSPPVLRQSTSVPILSPAQGYADNRTFPIFKGDFNGDGRTDIARVHGNGIVFYTATLNGQSFQLYRNLPFLSPAQGSIDAMSHPLFVGDWNGDGTTDFGRVTEYGVDFYNHTSNGFSYTDSIDSLSPRQGYANADAFPVLVGDWNGDGSDDVARVHGNGILFFRFERADGLHRDRFTQFLNFPNLSMGQNYLSAQIMPIVTGDWNGDRRTDFARVHGNGMLFYVFGADGTPRLLSNVDDFSPRHGYVNDNIHPLRVGDFNGDGLSDVARVGPSGVKILVSNGTGFEPYRALVNISPAQGYLDNSRFPFFAEDINGDGLSDLIRVHGNGVLVLTSKADGFEPAQNIPQGSPAQGYVNDNIFPMVLGDFNGNGKAGIARVHGSGLVWWEAS